MDLLDAAAIEFGCDVCGGQRAVTLRQILLSQDMLAGDRCLAQEGERECPPMAFASLMDRGLVEELQRAWQQLEERARAVGGRLSLDDGTAVPVRPHPGHL
jgi:hypothetical protein